jgi:predicted TIM-barrel fold metal-dependent hydrolase
MGAPAVDFHQHLWPEPFITALEKRRSPPKLRGAVFELADSPSAEVDLDVHSLTTRLALLDRDEVDVAVISLSPALGIGDLAAGEAEELLEAYEEGILELARSASGRIVPLAARRLRDGFAGVCLAASDLDDLDDVSGTLDALEQQRKLLFVHPGPARAVRADPLWWGEIVDYTAQMQAAYARWLTEGTVRWPGLRVVFAILAGGWPFQLERLGSRGIEARDTLSENMFFDTASYGRRALELCLATFGVGQIVYGSDVPVIDSRPTLDAVRSLGDAVGEALCVQNPARLLS